ncbi:MAG TPA: glycosyltransferase family 2 protein [Candidatus Methylomirabilis sp.]|nr:glycosyltransferase family 2 protein [Candidatus Methylomirabilis sp.]
MNKKVAVIISPNWHDYAEKYLDDCLAGIRAQDYPGEIKIFITDNETSEASYDFLRAKFSAWAGNFDKKIPEPEIWRNQTNDGFAKGCNDCLKKALAEGFDYFFNLSIHSFMEPSCISRLVEAAESDPRIGAVQALCLLDPEKNKILSAGNVTHFLGFGYCAGYREERGRVPAEISDIFYPSGGSFFLKREILEKVGMFDEVYWMYNEDQELGWRIWLAGLRCVLAPRAVMYSKFNFLRSAKKYYWLDRNRLLAIFECYEPLTLILIMPALAIMEIGLALFSLQAGWFKEKLKVWNYFLSYDNWEYIKKARRRNQSLRKIKDKELSRLITGKIWYQEVNDWKLRLINPIFNAYWHLVRAVLTIF